MKLNHTLTKEECDGLIGIILPKYKDDVDYVVEYGQKVELPTQFGANIVLGIEQPINTPEAGYLIGYRYDDKEVFVKKDGSKEEHTLMKESLERLPS